MRNPNHLLPLELWRIHDKPFPHPKEHKVYVQLKHHAWSKIHKAGYSQSLQGTGSNFALLKKQPIQQTKAWKLKSIISVEEREQNEHTFQGVNGQTESYE